MTTSAPIEAMFWGLLSAISLPIGALMGLWLKPSRRMGSCFAAFGAGALLFALTIELFAHVPHHVEEHGLFIFAVAAFGALFGGFVFDVLNQFLNNRGAFLRRLSDARRHVAYMRIRRTKKLIAELGRIHILNRLEPRQMASLIDHVRERRFAEGETVFRQGDTGDEMYFIISGEVDIVITTDEGERKTIASLDDNEVFGELGILLDMPRSADAIARSNLRLYAIDRNGLEHVSRENPAIHEALDELARTRIDEMPTESRHVRSRDWKKETLDHLKRKSHEITVEDILNEGTNKGPAAAAFAIWLGILVDGIPESLVIGMLAVSATGISMSFIVGVFLANVPEAMSSAVSMDRAGIGRIKILFMWGSICAITGVGALCGALLIPEHPEGLMLYFVVATETFAAGAMLTMIAETMMPEAYEQGGAIVGLSTLLGFLVTLFVKVL